MIGYINHKYALEQYKNTITVNTNTTVRIYQFI